MSTAQLILEYLKAGIEVLKVFLSPQVFAAIVALLFIAVFRLDIKALLLRIASIKFPGGGAELSTPQSDKEATAVENKKLPTPPPSDDIQLPPGLEKSEIETVRELLNAERGSVLILR